MDDEARYRVLLTINNIPKGRVSSFGRIAKAAGFPGRARWVGRILSQLPIESTLPWHRVLGHDGRITCPQQHLARDRLDAEGVAVRNLKIRMKDYVWPD